MLLVKNLLCCLFVVLSVPPRHPTEPLEEQRHESSHDLQGGGFPPGAAGEAEQAAGGRGDLAKARVWL